MIAAADATSNDHDNCNNNQSKPSVQGASPIVVGKAPEEHNRLNNNHIVPRIGDGAGSSPVPSSLPSPTVSTRSSVPRTDDVSIGPDCTATIDTTDTTSTHTTSDTVDQRLPVLNDVRTYPPERQNINPSATRRQPAAAVRH
ncbi:uncharacterized protein LOC128300277 [Anopheles moucheti]|uniref:uncharacterized protein LOC128300277 n=1 Tax=Anopheles moucheti TaxID=186751 RepID=UPI0022F1122E|nr:uncharacterized protein LOC128300277 [Anopheles moucheti]